MTVPVIRSTWTGGIGNSSTAGATTTISSVPPTANSDRVLIVCIGFEVTNEVAAYPQSVTYGGVALTELVKNPLQSSPTDNNSSIWYLLDADFPASSADVVVTWGAGTFSFLSGVVTAHVISGVDQTVANWDSAEGEGVANPSAELTASFADLLFLSVFNAADAGTAETVQAPSVSGLSNETLVHVASSNTQVLFAVASADSTTTGVKSLGWSTADGTQARPCWAAVSLPEPQGGGGEEETGSISEGTSAGSAFSAVASANASITEALSAGDSDAAIGAAEAALSASVSTAAQYTALAHAAAAIQAGIEAGESWASIAAAEAGITAGVQLGTSFIAETEGAQEAALISGTAAASAFLGAVAAFALLTEGVSANAAFSAAASVSGAVSAGVGLGASFATSTGNDGAVTAASALASLFSGAAASVGLLSDEADFADAYSAIGTALAAITVGAILGATFAATSSADADSAPITELFRIVPSIRRYVISRTAH